MVRLGHLFQRQSLLTSLVKRYPLRKYIEAVHVCIKINITILSVIYIYIFIPYFVLFDSDPCNFSCLFIAPSLSLSLSFGVTLMFSWSQNLVVVAYSAWSMPVPRRDWIDVPSHSFRIVVVSIPTPVMPHHRHHWLGD